MNRIKRIFICLIALALLIVPTVGIYGVQESVPYARYVRLSASEILSLLTGSPLGEIERGFVETYYDTELIYNAALPGELISIEGGSGTSAPYTTETLSGAPIAWTPDGALRFDPETGLVAADYVGSVSMNRDAANRLLNYAYNEASLASLAEGRIAAYNTALVAYRNYLSASSQYESDKLKYDAYVEAKAEYDQDYAAYLENQEAWKTYNEKLSLYNDYRTAKDAYDTAYAAYQTAQAAYVAARQEYDTAYRSYVNNQNKISTVLEPMESMFIRYGDWDGTRFGSSMQAEVGTMYQALQNEDLVAMLMAYKNKICSATSLTPATFDNLKKTSDELNAILEQYATLREESMAAAFGYYKQNYTAIRDKFNHLYDAMSSILKPSVYSLMCAAVDEEYGKDMAVYKKWRIRNVLCQIYMVSEALDDSSTRTAQWNFYADNGDPCTYYYSTFLNQNQILTDNNKSNPSALSWREAPVEPVAPVAPVAPTPVAKPTKPLETLEEPTAPTEVTEPTKPTAVSEPSAPASADYERVNRCAEILSLWKSGALTQRLAFAVDATLLLHETLYRRYDPATGEAALSIYNQRGELVEDRNEVAVEFEGEDATYLLLGFRESEDGLCRYPVYEREDRIFTVTFRSEGGVISQETYGYGQTPVAPAAPQKASSNTTVYEFERWEPALAPVRQNTTYEAVFSQSERIYTVTFRMHEGDVIRYCVWQEMPEAPTPISQYRDGIYLYRFIGWNRTVSAVTADVVYEAKYYKTVLVETPPEEPGDTPEPPADSGSGGTSEPPVTDGGNESDTTGGGSSSGGTNLIQNQNGYVVETDGSRLQISALLELCSSQSKGLTFTFSKYGNELVLSRSMITSLHDAGVATVSFVHEGLSGGRGVGVSFLSGTGEPVSVTGVVRLSLPVEKSGGTLYVRQYSASGEWVDHEDAEVVNGAVLVDVENGYTYKLIRKYTLTMETVGEGTAHLDAFLFEEGERIPLALYPKAGYRLGSLELRNEQTGESVSFVDAEDLVMQAFDGVLRITFEEEIYKIEFRYFGGSVEQYYRFGETVTPPTIPISFVADGMYYTFTGWSRTVEAATEDTVYEATYEILPESMQEDGGTGTAMEGVVRYWILPAAGIFAGVVALTVGAVIAIRVIKKKKSK